jgi:signal peptidase I
MNRDIDKPRKNKIIAVLLNLILAGAGYFYIGQFKKSFLFLPLVLIYMIAFYYILTIFETGYLSLLFYISFLFIYIYMLYDTVKTISKKEDIYTKYNGFLGVAGFIVIFYALGQLYILFAPIKSYIAPSDSMANTIMMGDIIIANSNKEISRGDLVVFLHPQKSSVVFLKRCVAVEEDKIIYEDGNLFIHFHEGDRYITNNYPSNKIVTIWDKLWVKNPYKEKFPGINYMGKKELNSFQQLIIRFPDIGMEPILVKELNNDIYNVNGGMNAFYKEVEPNHFFMMGDNRDNSNDSRFLGSVPKENIKGKVKSILTNFSDLSRSGTLVK